MAIQGNQQTILDLLRDLREPEPLKRLFWQELDYDRANEPISTRSWKDYENTALAEDPVLFATAGEGDDFHVIYCRLRSEGRLRITDERILINRLIGDHLYSLFVFSDASQENWHFVNVRNDPNVTKRRIFRRVTIGPCERLRTASERISLLDIDRRSAGPSGLTVLEIQQRHDEAFDAEAVTRQFFEDYCVIFRSLQQELLKCIGDRKSAHDYALSFLNRLMFLYFIQRKRWLGSDIDFIRSYWNAYSDVGRPKDTFFEGWLKPLFFRVFDNDKGLFNSAKMGYIPENLRTILATAPYLNGGLFSESDLDTPGEPFNIPDVCIRETLDFLDGYNFTIAEDSPLDQEVAVDPEMIGKVYESLVNVSEETTERGDAGIFYTPRTEIDLMCRLALVDNLSN